MAELSVVIPTFDTRDMTLRCCEAAILHSPPATEFIVVDDGSRDGTASAIETRFPEVRLLVNQQNSGFAVSVNRGVAQSRAPIVLLLNSDAEVGPGIISSILSEFSRFADTGIIGAQLLNRDGTKQWSGGAKPGFLWILAVVSGVAVLGRYFPGYRRLKPIDRRGTEVDWVSGAVLAMRRAVWDAAGPLDEHFLFYAQDLAFCLRAREAGWKVRIGSFSVTHLMGATRGGGEARMDLAALWPDLLTWWRDSHSILSTAVLKWSMCTVLLMRILLRWLFSFFSGRGRRSQHGTNGVLIKALKVLAGPSPPSKR